MDLAGSPRNKTGCCVLDVGEVKVVSLSLLLSDDDIVSFVESANPFIVAVDAPLVYTGVRRRCDELLQGYGAIPVTLRGMEALAKRGVILAGRLRGGGFNCVEVHSTSSAKILGVYDKVDFTLQKNLVELGLKGDIESRILVRDELDAILAALTGYLHGLGGTEVVGDDCGRIAVPRV